MKVFMKASTDTLEENITKIIKDCLDNFNHLSLFFKEQTNNIGFGRSNTVIITNKKTGETLLTIAYVISNTDVIKKLEIQAVEVIDYNDDDYEPTLGEIEVHVDYKLDGKQESIAFQTSNTSDPGAVSTDLIPFEIEPSDITDIIKIFADVNNVYLDYVDKYYQRDTNQTWFDANSECNKITRI